MISPNQDCISSDLDKSRTIRCISGWVQFTSRLVPNGDHAVQDIWRPIQI